MRSWVSGIVLKGYKRYGHENIKRTIKAKMWNVLIKIPSAVKKNNI